ncbi:MAG: branched-chain amino acid ABC transporter permease [Bdellovibrionales bacterium CG12_big_fil_rev_8_21_14_0_65_38_15]|nr:MAG: branched-chain amino acid ABC transporter permease [Bdellovibrionales bacterium CG22_combo_CG10-13_8_21_14_all_38_13]PIQ56360.1 MAG: branched-chain amino acid ABC transporter permease [Bdellovibrionales bacterium CG12_big_fil_rev_8_21_14_0_65_38_15]PIR29391.1 MAG: branched-chain amino acid ABC transporter permease [Bdellovibrionales bacterium CG11_big_fil_rev_8_21_14_0_20_38_13]
MDYLIYLTIQSGIFIILAVSLNLINGICGQFSLGHAGFWAVGAYVGAAYSVFFALPVPDFVNLLIGCGLGFSAAAIAGLAIGVPCLRLRGDYLAIATLGFGEIIRIIIMNMDSVGGPRGFTGIPAWSNFFWVYLFVAITIIFVVNLLRGTHGRAIISIREDEIAAESMGIYTFKYKVLAFVIGAGFAGVAGVLFAHTTQFIHPNSFNFMWSVIILLMIILGGLGSVTGSVVGAIILSLLPEVLRFFGETVSEWRMVIYSVLLICLMLWRPSGIFGKHELDIKKLFGMKKGDA